MHGNQNVARSTFKKCKTLLKSLQSIRVCHELEFGRRDRGQAVGVNHSQAMVSLAGFPCPTGSAGRMTGSEMCGDRDVPDVKNLLLIKMFHVLDFGNIRDKSVLWIIPGDS